MISLSAARGIALGAYEAAVSPSVGVDGADDVAQLEFYGASAAPGTYDLADEINASYASCVTCVRIFEIDAAGAVRAEFFQQSGSVELREDAELTGLDATLSDVILIEATIGTDFVTTPVPGGACLSIPSATLTATAAAD